MGPLLKENIDINKMESREQPRPAALFDYYDYPFASNDAIITTFNVIERHFLNYSPSKHDIAPSLRRIDPRTGRSVTRKYISHVSRFKNHIFKGASRSILSKDEQDKCLGFLESLKNRQTFKSDQACCFNETVEKRKTEKEDFLKFVQLYSYTHFFTLYSPERLLESAYERLYRFEAKRIMAKYRNTTYQLQTGFPLPVTLCTTDSSGRIVNPKSLLPRDPAPLPTTNVDFSVLGANLEKFLDVYMKEEMNTKTPVIDAGEIDFEIPIDTLVFLLGGEDNVDTPKEVLVTIFADNSIIQLSDPFPARNMGVQTSSQVVNKCLQPFLNISQKKDCPEIQANNFSGQYSLQSCDEYMKKYVYCQSSTRVPYKHDFVEWNLGIENSETEFTILTRTTFGCVDAQQRRVFPSVKLEFKPEIGCEIMAKHCLIREWFEHKLCDAPQVVTERYRLKASDFKCIQRENAILPTIEEELFDEYKHNMNQLMGGFWSFLSLLKTIPPGRYMFCYNPNFRGKLMLYNETPTQTSKTFVALYDLLQETPNNIEFSLQMKMIPVSSTVYSDVHTDHRMLPGAFHPGSHPRTTKYTYSDDQRHRAKIMAWSCNAKKKNKGKKKKRPKKQSASKE